MTTYFPGEVERRLGAAGMSPRRVEGGRELAVACPECRAEGEHFTVSAETGAAHCFKCKHSTHLEKLAPNGERKNSRRSLTSLEALERDLPAWQQALREADDRALEYWQRRGVDRATLISAGVGLLQRNETIEYVIPSLARNGRVLSAAYLALDGRPRIRKGCTNQLVGLHLLTDENPPVVLPEGIKDYLRALAARLPAVGTLGGASGFTEEMAKRLAGCEVWVPADNDTAGRRWAATQVAPALWQQGCRVRILDLGLATAKADLTDWLNDGHSADELRALASQTQPWQPSVTSPTPSTPERSGSQQVPYPRLPEKVWRRCFALYRDALAQTTEAPDEYHFASLLTAAGSVLGRAVIVPYGRPLHANVFCCLCGRSADARKTTAAYHGVEMAMRADEGLALLRGLSSFEGLLETFPEPENRLLPERRLLLVHNELRSLLGKAKQEGSAGLIPGLTELYDAPTVYELRRVRKPVRLDYPVLSFLTASTPAWLEVSLKEVDFQGGLASRFVFFLGDPKTANPFPQAPDAAKLNQVAEILGKARRHWLGQAVANGGPVPLTFADEARECWRDHYTRLHTRVFRSDLTEVAARRDAEHVLKIALIMAALELQDSLTLDIMNGAIAVGDYLELCTRQLFEGFVLDERSRLSQKMVEIVRRGPLSKRELQQKLSGRVSAAEFSREVTALLSIGVLRPVKPRGSGRGRPKQLLELVEDE